MSLRRSLFALVLASSPLFVTCKLDPGAKTACLSDGDCLAGRRCVAGTCEAALPPPGDASESPDRSDFASCDSLSSDPACPGEDAEPMKCVQASTLGGQDFCAPSCDPAQPVADPVHTTCIAMGALLPRCQPSTYADAGADCPAGLSCFRTSLVFDEGVCMRMPVCAADTDCPSAVYNRCAGGILGGAASSLPSFIHLDHLNCVHPNCSLLQSDCPAAEGCLASEYSSSLSDICAPNCDSNGSCPPDYSCTRATAGAGSPNLCTPNLPGVRCQNNSCLVGDCEDTGAGFSVCTIPCTSTGDCAVLNTSEESFVCVESGGQSHCVTPVPFDGANCDTTAQCRTDLGEFCAPFDGFGQQATRSECRLPCHEDGTCDPVGGLPHSCVAGGAGGCYPGTLGVACVDGTGCIPPLDCQSAPAEPDDAGAAARICTLACGVDEGSDADGQCLILGQPGYCSGGYCRSAHGTGQICTRPGECTSGLCDAATHTCLAEPPSGGL